ncbi:NAD(P)-dependent alcohol dehydrogenase [Aspergillus undulatus]|uniref:NAD(P)-dependent alcohol dehydrogenase n=1 Tax=Aspergillus undulatus TaxID=1810928 RepID=UPI003CCD795E
MAVKTEALVSREVNVPPKLEAITLDNIRADEVLVEIHATGICHTDFSCMNGTLPAAFPSAGVVVDAGEKVTHVSKGDKVLLSFDHCGACYQCDEGHPAYCAEWVPRNFGQKRPDGSLTLADASGAQLHGSFFGQSSFARHTIVSSASVVKVPTDTRLDLFSPLGCGIQTGAGAILNTLDVQPGKSVAIFGVGSVGMSAVMAAKLRNAKIIIAVDLQPQRLEAAKKLGATHAVNGGDADVVAQIQKISGKNGVDYSVDCAGVPQVVEKALDCLGTRGKGATVGAPSPGVRAGVDVFSHLVLGRQYVGCCEGDSDTQKFLPYLIEQHNKGLFPLDEMVTYYPVNEFEKAFKEVKEGKALKGVLLWN